MFPNKQFFIANKPESLGFHTKSPTTEFNMFVLTKKDNYLMQKLLKPSPEACVF